MIVHHTDHYNMNMYEGVFHDLRVVGSKLRHDAT